jgi:hypothetical protein
MSQDSLDSFNREEPYGKYQPKYPSKKGFPLSHGEMDYNLDLIGQVIKGYRVMGLGPGGNLDLDNDNGKILKLYKVQAGDTILQANGAIVGDFVWVLGDAVDSGNAGVNGYIHNQGNPSATWAISHGLNKRPSVTVVDSAGTMVSGQTDYIDSNNIELTFNAPFSGQAYLN